MRTIIRLVSLLLLASLLAWAPGARAAIPAPPATPTATGYGGAAATVDPYATQTAIDVLRAGGNAVDAAVAASAVIGVVEPYSAGIGGGGFMVLRTRGGTLETIDGREYAPAAFQPTSFLDPATGQPIPFPEAVTSGLGVGVPGTLRTWQLALQRHGTWSLRRALQPAIALAREGFVVDATLSQQTVANAARFADFPASAELFLPGGEPLQPGDVLVNEDLADTYELIARRGADAFYRGALAQDIVDTVSDPPVRDGATRTVRPGLMTRSDLSAYRALRRPPALSTFRHHLVAGMQPPSSGGTTIAEALNIIEALGAPASDVVEHLHRYLEASRLAFADRNVYIGDPAFVDVPLDCLLSQRFANGRAELVGDTATPSPAGPGLCPDGEPPTASDAAEGPSTTNLTVADDRGGIVEYTFTIEQTGGSAITVPGRGFLLNNELTDFNFTPGTANSPDARKRPRSSMAPTLVLHGKRPVLALGSPGGATIITTVLQTILNVFDRGMSLPDALAAPRLSQRNLPATQVEPGFLGSPEAAGLQARGHTLTEVPELGAATGIEFRRGGELVAAAEPARRGGGSAMVVRETPEP